MVISYALLQHGQMPLNWGDAMLAVLLATVSTVFLVAGATNLWWSMHAWRNPTVHEEISRRRRPGHLGELRFSAIVPFRRERESVVRETVRRLLQQSYEHVEIVLSVGHDDSDAVLVANSLRNEFPDRIKMSIDLSAKKNKPKQLNSALRKCGGDFVTVLDAESLTHEGLFEHAAQVLTETGADVLQAGVQLVNHRSRWFSLRNCLEYYFWFRSRLHLHARHGFVPLGGNTLFVRREVLDSVGGWNRDMLTEDCDLGVRLSSHGVGIVVSYDPKLVTREETPDTVSALVRQRSRWNQGFLQVLGKGDWRRLPARRQRALAAYTLLQPYLQALTFLVLPLALAGVLFLDLPLALTLLMFAPLLPLLLTLMFEVATLGEFGADLGLVIRLRDYAVLVVTLIPYQIVLGYAAVRAVLRFWQGAQTWEKTPHLGHHLETPVLAAERAA